MSGNISDELTHLSANNLQFTFVLYGVLDALNFVFKHVVDDNNKQICTAELGNSLNCVPEAKHVILRKNLHKIARLTRCFPPLLYMLNLSFLFQFLQLKMPTITSQRHRQNEASQVSHIPYFLDY